MFKKRKQSGFTLIEVIVSVTLYTIIILLSTKIFIMVIQSQRSAIASQNVQESLKYFFEVTGKEMRMAQKNDLPAENCQDIPSTQIFKKTKNVDGDDSLIFKNRYGQCVQYSIINDSENNGIKRFQISRNGQEGFISPAKIAIDYLHFVLKPTGSSQQAVVTMNLKAHAIDQAKFESNMSLQSTISSRYYK